MHYYCCRSSQLCVQKGLCVSVSGSEGSLFMCVPVLLYAHMNISIHLCIVVFWNKWNWVSVSAAQDGRSLYCSNINMNIWTCPCAGSCVSEGARLVLLLGYLGTVNWSPSWVSRLLESLRNQDLNPLKPPKTHLLIVPLLCWQHLESSIVIRRVYCYWPKLNVPVVCWKTTLNPKERSVVSALKRIQFSVVCAAARQLSSSGQDSEMVF